LLKAKSMTFGGESALAGAPLFSSSEVSGSRKQDLRTEQKIKEKQTNKKRKHAFKTQSTYVPM